MSEELSHVDRVAGAPTWIRTTGLPLRRKVTCGFCNADQRVARANSTLCRICALIEVQKLKNEAASDPVCFSILCFPESPTND